MDDDGAEDGLRGGGGTRERRETKLEHAECAGHDAGERASSASALVIRRGRRQPSADDDCSRLRALLILARAKSCYVVVGVHFLGPAVRGRTCALDPHHLHQNNSNSARLRKLLEAGPRARVEASIGGELAVERLATWAPMAWMPKRSVCSLFTDGPSLGSRHDSVRRHSAKACATRKEEQ